MQSTGKRYSVAFTSGEANESSGYGFETISDALDYAQVTGLSAGMEAIITDRENTRPALAVRIAR